MSTKQGTHAAVPKNRVTQKAKPVTELLKKGTELTSDQKNNDAGDAGRDDAGRDLQSRPTQ